MSSPSPWNKYIDPSSGAPYWVCLLHMISCLFLFFMHLLLQSARRFIFVLAFFLVFSSFFRSTVWPTKALGMIPPRTFFFLFLFSLSVITPIIHISFFLSLFTLPNHSNEGLLYSKRWLLLQWQQHQQLILVAVCSSCNSNKQSCKRATLNCNNSWLRLVIPFPCFFVSFSFALSYIRLFFVVVFVFVCEFRWWESMPFDHSNTIYVLDLTCETLF